MLNPNAQSGINARQNIYSLKGGQGNGFNDGTGAWEWAEKYRNTGSQQDLNKYNKDWNTIGSHLKGTGITQSQFNSLDKYGPETRLRRLETLLAKTQNNPGSKVAGTNADAKSQTVEVKFTGQAARWFTTVGSNPTTAKNSANSGGTSMTQVNNQSGGDPGKNLPYKADW